MVKYFTEQLDELDEFNMSCNSNRDTIDMKCSNCGYEEKMPSWCYAEVVEMEEDDPRITCPKCNAEELRRK